MKALLTLLFVLLSFSSLAKDVLIEKGVKEVDVLIDDDLVEIKRNQNRSAKIMKFYQDTWRGKIQPLFPFKPYPVDTVAELEVIDYIQQISHGNDNVLIVDARPQSATTITGLIPGAIRIENKKLITLEDRKKTLEIFGVIHTDKGYDFSDAKTLVLYCNGLWCGKSPRMIRRLIGFGYPAEKLKYYRGGMQAWRAVGLTTVSE